MVSVCVPAYNAARYLAEALDSVFSQTFRDFELLVVDNNSSDETAAVVSRYTDKRLHYQKNSTTVSMAENWNICLSLCRGKYVCILHADDRFQQDLLEKEVKLMENNLAIGLVFAAVNIIDNRSQTVGQSIPFPDNYVCLGLDEFKKHILGNYLFCPAVMVRRDAYVAAGGFRANLRHLLDWEMWLRLELLLSQIAYIAEPLADYRIHPKSASASAGYINTRFEFAEWCQVITDTLSGENFWQKYDKTQAQEIINRLFIRICIRYIKLSTKYLLLGKIKEYCLMTKQLVLIFLHHKANLPSLGLAGTILSYLFNRRQYYGYDKRFGYAPIVGLQKQKRL